MPLLSPGAPSFVPRKVKALFEEDLRNEDNGKSHTLSAEATPFVPLKVNNESIDLFKEDYCFQTIHPIHSLSAEATPFVPACNQNENQSIQDLEDNKTVEADATKDRDINLFDESYFKTDATNEPEVLEEVLINSSKIQKLSDDEIENKHELEQEMLDPSSDPEVSTPEPDEQSHLSKKSDVDCHVFPIYRITCSFAWTVKERKEEQSREQLRNSSGEWRAVSAANLLPRLVLRHRHRNLPP